MRGTALCQLIPGATMVLLLAAFICFAFILSYLVDPKVTGLSR